MFLKLMFYCLWALTLWHERRSSSTGTGGLTSQECSNSKCKSWEKESWGYKKKLNTEEFLRRDVLGLKFKHEGCWRGRGRGWFGGGSGGGGVANQKAAPGPAVYNSVSQGLSDATTEFLQPGRLWEDYRLRLRARTHTQTYTHLCFCSALSARARKEHPGGLFLRALRREGFPSTMSTGQTYEKKIACILTDLPGSMSCHPNSKDSPTLPESSVTDMGYFSGQTAHGQHEYYQSQAYGQPMNSYHHQFNLNGMGAAGAYATKSEYPYSNGYRQFGHYNRDHLQASPPSSGKRPVETCGREDVWLSFTSVARSPMCATLRRSR